MTQEQLIAKLKADRERLEREIANLHRALAERQTMLAKAIGALEALALLKEEESDAAS